jgi:membrane protein DedA with SNARE-associated domain
MDLGNLIQTYGYLAVAVGCLLEGETLLALAGFAAHSGHLGLPQVIVIAAVAGFAGDQFFFWLGRRHGGAVLQRWPSVAARAERVHALIERYHEWVIVGVRFAYGLRIAGPILIGTSAVPAWRFALFNAIGAALWAPAIALSGWFFGHLIEVFLGDLRRIEQWGLLALVGVGIALWWWRRRREPH